MDKMSFAVKTRVTTVALLVCKCKQVAQQVLRWPQNDYCVVPQDFRGNLVQNRMLSDCCATFVIMQRVGAGAGASFGVNT